MRKILILLNNERGHIITWVIIAAMTAIIAVGVVTSWHQPIKDLNSAGTSRLIVRP